MDKSSWNTIEQIFYEVFELPVDQRTARVRELAGGDVSIEAEVESLLESYRDDELWIDNDSVTKLQEAVQSTVGLLLERRIQSTEGKLARRRSVESSDDAWVLETLESHGERFRFETVLGRGGMGVVVRAFDRVLQRRVAVKIVYPQKRDLKHQRQFLQESRIIAQLQSDHIVNIYEVVENETTPCLVMEWVRGPSIRRMIDSRRRIAPRFAAEIARQVAMGLSHAHSAMQTHRDIKPSNILLQRRSGKQMPWRAKIVDFGLARSLEVNPDRTVENALLGTPTYMSPEQIVASGQVDLRSDIYSLGVTLYEMLVGEPPFRGSPHMLIRQIESCEPRMLREWDDRIPKDLESICMKAMAKEPHKRYATADEFSQDLTRFLEGRPTVARPVSKLEQIARWANRNRSLASAISIVAGLLVVVLVGSILSSAMLYRKNRQVAEAQSRAHQALLESLATSDPAFVAGVLDQIEHQIPDRIPSLWKLFEQEQDPQGKFNLACALSAFGQAKHEYLLENLERAPTEVGQCVALIRAFSRESEQAKLLMAERFHRSTSSKERVKLSMLALHLGDPELAMVVTDATKDPDQRTLWIHQLSDWHGPLEDLIGQAEVSNHQPLVSAILLGLGLIDPVAWSTTDRERLEAGLPKWLTSDQPGVRGAAKWLAATRITSVKDASQTNSQSFDRSKIRNFDMVPIQAGIFQMGNEDPSLQYTGRTAHEVRLTRDFQIADREVSIEEYRRFLDDGDYPEDAKPKERQAWTYDEVVSPTSQHPVQRITWDEAVLYCNWLSLREGFKPVYVLNGKQTIEGDRGETIEFLDWKRDDAADGYRLPTEAEFEYACRAGTNSSYFFGNDRSFLHYYAAWSNNSRVPAGVCGSHLPNPWGLFEMHGNVWEWSDDWYRDFPPEGEVDPRGNQPHPYGKVFRGGGVCTFSGDPVSCSRGRAVPDVRYLNLGFRVARN